MTRQSLLVVPCERTQQRDVSVRDVKCCNRTHMLAVRIWFYLGCCLDLSRDKFDNNAALQCLHNSCQLLTLLMSLPFLTEHALYHALTCTSVEQYVMQKQGWELWGVCCWCLSGFKKLRFTVVSELICSYKCIQSVLERSIKSLFWVFSILSSSGSEACYPKCCPSIKAQWWFLLFCSSLWVQFTGLACLGR